MKITVEARLFAKGNMNVNTAHNLSSQLAVAVFSFYHNQNLRIINHSNL